MLPTTCDPRSHWHVEVWDESGAGQQFCLPRGILASRFRRLLRHLFPGVAIAVYHMGTNYGDPEEVCPTNP